MKHKLISILALSGALVLGLTIALIMELSILQLIANILVKGIIKLALKIWNLYMVNPFPITQK